MRDEDVVDVLNAQADCLKLCRQNALIRDISPAAAVNEDVQAVVLHKQRVALEGGGVIRVGAERPHVRVPTRMLCNSPLSAPSWWAVTSGCACGAGERATLEQWHIETLRPSRGIFHMHAVPESGERVTCAHACATMTGMQQRFGWRLQRA